MERAPELPEMGQLTIAIRGETWDATVEALSERHMRVALRPGQPADLPQWVSGSAVECAIEMDDGRYHASATVVKQVSRWVWLRIPPTWTPVERRAGSRVPTDLTVHYTVDGVRHESRCTDLSAGGLRLRVAQPLSRWKRLHLDFELPAGIGVVKVEGVTLYAIPVRGGEMLDVGVKFVSLAPKDGARIARFCRAAESAD